MDNILLHVPYVYLQKESDYIYNFYVIVVVREGEDARFEKRDHPSSTEIMGRITGEKTSNKLVYKNAIISLDYRDVPGFDPANREVNIGFQGVNYKRKMTLFTKDADSNTSVLVENAFALNSPYLYLTQIEDIFTSDVYYSRLLLPVKGYAVASENIIETKGKIGILENSIQLQESSKVGDIEILSDFKVNTESYKDSDEYLEGFYTVIVEAIQNDIIDELPEAILDASEVTYSMAGSNSSCSETKVRSCGAESTSNDLFDD